LTSSFKPRVSETNDKILLFPFKSVKITQTKRQTVHDAHEIKKSSHLALHYMYPGSINNASFAMFIINCPSIQLEV
jgi:hypothetical protein